MPLTFSKILTNIEFSVLSYIFSNDFKKPKKPEFIDEKLTYLFYIGNQLY